MDPCDCFKATGRVVCTAASPIYSSTGKDITGVVMMSIELKFLTDIIDKMKIGKAGYAYMVDKNGLYIVHPVKEKILKENISQIKGRESIAKLVKEGKSGIAEYNSKEFRKQALVASVPITGWSVVSSIPVEDLYAPAVSNPERDHYHRHDLPHPGFRFSSSSLPGASPFP